MKLWFYSLKNIVISWWRSLTLGSFIFFISLFLVFFNSFSFTVKNRMENTIVNGLTGHIQLRSGKSKEGDMADLYRRDWQDIDYLDTNKLQIIRQVLDHTLEQAEYTQRVRHNVIFLTDTAQEPCMVIGLEPSASAYTRALELTAGDYLKPGERNQVILLEERARKLNVKVGDVIGVMAQTKDGYMVDAALTVQGIANFKAIAVFGVPYAYMDLESVQELMGFYQAEVTDVIINLENTSKVDQIKKDIAHSLNQKGLSVALTQDIDNPDLRISSWENMGGFFMSMVTVYNLLIYILIGCLMLVVCFLIINLIYMVGLERYKEIGTLRAIGYNKKQVMWLFIAEILIITAIFGLSGILIGALIVLIFSHVGIPSPVPSMNYLMGERLYLLFDWQGLIPVVLILFCFAICSAFYPAYKASSLRPGEAIRET